MSPLASSDWISLLTLAHANTRVVLFTMGVLGLAAGVVGTFAMLRRRALASDALAHAALPGLCLAYLVVGTKSMGWFLAGAAVSGVLGLLLVALIRRFTRIKEDTALGFVLSAFFGLGVVLSRLIQNQPGGNRAGLEHFIFGQAAAMVRSDAWAVAAVALAVLVVCLLLFKEFQLLSFDPGFARSLGWSTVGLDQLMSALVIATTVIGLQAVGVVLIVALMVIPPAAARFWTERLGVLVILSGVFGMVSGVLGAALSAVPLPGLKDPPTGPLVVLVAAALFVFSLLFAPRRGLIARLIELARLRARLRTAPTEELAHG